MGHAVYETRRPCLCGVVTGRIQRVSFLIRFGRFHVFGVRRIVVDRSSFVRFRSCVFAKVDGYADVICALMTHWIMLDAEQRGRHNS